MIGTLYGISLGPGDPELITLKGLRLLQSADVVFVPVAEVSAQAIAAQIAQPLLRDGQTIEPLMFAMRGSLMQRLTAWQVAAARIATVLEAGQNAAFLVEGDASTYSTFAHIAATLRQTHPLASVEVVPGVTSFAAAAARTRMTLVDADQRMTVLPATHDSAALEETLRAFDTIVLMKIAGRVPEILDALTSIGRLSDATFIERCGHPDERIVLDIQQLRDTTVDYFSLIIVRRDSTQLEVVQQISDAV